MTIMWYDIIGKQEMEDNMKFIRNVFIILLIIFALIVGIKINEGYELYNEAITAFPLEDKVAEIKSVDNYTKLDEVPEIYIKAVISAEDHRFFLHKGVDIVSIISAVWHDIESRSLAQGGSTITQQIAKNIYFTQEKKLKRKIAEIFMAFELEKNYSKEEILELYMNTSYYGDGCYTVKEASRKYFNKEPIDMTDYESILLAGVPNAPSVYAPTVNMELCKKRQLQVIRKMIKFGALTEEEAKAILESGGNNVSEI